METQKIPLKGIFISILVVSSIFLLGLTIDREMFTNAVMKMNVGAYRIQKKLTLSPTSPPPTSPPNTTTEETGPYHVAYPRNYKYIMDDTPVCKTRFPLVVLVVPMAPVNVKGRDAIRKTWGGEKEVRGQLVDTLFLVGLPIGDEAEQQQEKLIQENRQHHDLIQSDFQDSYHNLTIKTMMMLEWLVARCDKTAYVMKVDSDVLVHVPNLVKLLLNPNTTKENYTTGLVWWASPVIRDPSNRFYLPQEIIAESVFPPYPLGMAYVMSMDLPKKILSVSPKIKPHYIEDAYLGMCLKLLGISPTDQPEDTMFIVAPTHPLSNCTLSKVIAVMTYSVEQMTENWDRTKTPALTADPCKAQTN